MKIRQILVGQQLLYFGSQPNREVQRQRVAVIEVGQNRERSVGIGFEFLGKFLNLGHDRDDLAADRLDPIIGLNHRPDVQPAIWTPVTAIKHYGDRSLLQKRVQADQPAGVVRQNEGRHRIAGPRRVFAAAIFVDSRDQAINGLAVSREVLPAGRGVGLQLFVQGPFHVAALLEGQFETFGIGRRQRRHGLLRRIRLLLILFSSSGRPQGAA